MDSLDLFEQVVAKDDENIDLARACLLIARDAYPDLDVERYVAELEGLAIRLRSRLPRQTGTGSGKGSAAEQAVVALNQFLYEDLGFWGNTDDYYDPRNSYL